MFFRDGYFGLSGNFGQVDRDGCGLFGRWLKKRSGGQGSEETSGRCGANGRNDWRRNSLLGAGDLRVRG